jgi:hypothetical protein
VSKRPGSIYRSGKCKDRLKFKEPSRAGGEARGGRGMGEMKRRDQLAQIESHIAQCEALIARQHEIIRNAQQKGRDASWAKDTLKALEASLHAFQKHRQFILDRQEKSDRR